MMNYFYDLRALRGEKITIRVIAVNKAGEGNLTSWYSRFTL